MCARVCAPVGEKGSRNEGKVWSLSLSLFFFTESKKSIHDLKEVYEFLAWESMAIDFCASAWAVHVHYKVMKAVFCWA